MSPTLHRMKLYFRSSPRFQHHSLILWVVTTATLFFYKLNKRTYNRIVEVIRHRAAKKRG